MSELADVIDRVPTDAVPYGDSEELRQVLSERRQAEMLLSGEKKALEMIAANAPLESILDAINRVIETRLPATLGSILLLDAAEGRLRHGSAPSLPTAYNAAILDHINLEQ